MNTQQIEAAMKCTVFSKHHFGGVFAADQIDNIEINKKHLPQCFVFNYDPSYKPGSHWVAAIVNPRGRSNLFFDSYGKPPALKSIHLLLNSKYKYNHIQYQNELTSTCGEWCVFFLWYHLTRQRKSWNSIFTKKFTLKNDELVNWWMKETFGQKLKVLNVSFLRSQIAKTQKFNIASNPLFDTPRTMILRLARRTLRSFPSNRGEDVSTHKHSHRASQRKKCVRFAIA